MNIFRWLWATVTGRVLVRLSTLGDEVIYGYAKFDKKYRYWYCSWGVFKETGRIRLINDGSVVTKGIVPVYITEWEPV